MTDWQDQMEYFPDWKDADRAIEMLLADGTIVRGRLWLEDVFPSDGDEVPLWRVVPSEAPLFPEPGCGFAFFEGERFRFTD